MHTRRWDTTARRTVDSAIDRCRLAAFRDGSAGAVVVLLTQPYSVGHHRARRRRGESRGGLTGCVVQRTDTPVHSRQCVEGESWIQRHQHQGFTHANGKHERDWNDLRRMRRQSDQGTADSAWCWARGCIAARHGSRGLRREADHSGTPAIGCRGCGLRRRGTRGCKRTAVQGRMLRQIAARCIACSSHPCSCSPGGRPNQGLRRQTATRDFESGTSRTCNCFSMPCRRRKRVSMKRIDCATRSCGNGHGAAQGWVESYHRPRARRYLTSCLRIDCSSLRRSTLGSGYAMSRPLNVSIRICDTISRALSLSSAGTAYHGAVGVLVAVIHSP